MNVASPYRKDLLWRIPALYFFLLGTINFGFALLHTVSWIDVFGLLFFSAPFVVNKKSLNLIFGFLYCLFWILLLTVLIVVHHRYLGGKHYSNPYFTTAQYLAMAYSLTFFSLTASVLLGVAGLPPVSVRQPQYSN